MLSDPGYLRRWKRKLAWYREHNILPHEEGGGQRGTLVVTEDSLNGAISSKRIADLIITVVKS